MPTTIKIMNKIMIDVNTSFQWQKASEMST
jgi:hypothetical protein